MSTCVRYGALSHIKFRIYYFLGIMFGQVQIIGCFNIPTRYRDLTTMEFFYGAIVDTKIYGLLIQLFPSSYFQVHFYALFHHRHIYDKVRPDFFFSEKEVLKFVILVLSDI